LYGRDPNRWLDGIRLSYLAAYLGAVGAVAMAAELTKAAARSRRVTRAAAALAQPLAAASGEPSAAAESAPARPAERNPSGVTQPRHDPFGRVSCCTSLLYNVGRCQPYHQQVDPAADTPDPDDVLVVIGHPFGDVEVPLAVWIAKGPGPRPFVRPVRAQSRSTGQPLPLSVIPLRYRNDPQSRRAIEDGLLENPWPDSNAGT
jgi:hypothetical protein